MGADYLSVVTIGIIGLISGGGWLSARMSSRISECERRLNSLPVEYVLKSDHIRELLRMNEEFDKINAKLDKMMDYLLK